MLDETATTLLDTRRGLLLEEQISYVYDRPIRHLRHRLVVVPRATHGAQLRRDFGVTVSPAAALVSVGTDEFSNCVVDIDVRAVKRVIEFSVWALITADGGSVLAPRALLDDVRLLRPTMLTEPDGRLGEIGRELRAGGGTPLAIAEAACGWASGAISYEFGVTGVRTTASAALDAGRGVCQDYAHLMLAVCRAAGVAARYVSGHLVGEGGSHAWVEVLDEAPSGDGAVAVGFDPTHNRRVDDRYLTVAVGRDYADVPPTSGTFRGRGRGELRVTKRLSSVPLEAR